MTTVRISFLADVSFIGEAVVPLLRSGMKPNFCSPSMPAETMFFTGVFEPVEDIHHGQTRRCEISLVTRADFASFIQARHSLDMYGKSVRKLGSATIIEVRDILNLGE